MALAEDTELWLIRHGETEFNAESRIQGQLDVALNQIGKKQATKTAEYLYSLKSSGIQFSALFSSDLSRTVETATPIAQKLNLEIKTDKRLREMNFGEFQKFTVMELQKKGAWNDWSASKQCPSGESFLELQQRVVNSLQEITTECKGQRILVVTHGGPIKAYWSHVLQCPIEKGFQIHTGNASITKIQPFRTSQWFFKTRGKILSFADNSHLTAKQENQNDAP